MREIVGSSMKESEELSGSSGVGNSVTWEGWRRRRRQGEVLKIVVH